SFTYHASDGAANSATATVTITVNAVPPSFTNAPPTVSIISPTNGAVFVAPQNVSVVADASDADGTVTNVTFFQASTRLGATETPPYYVVWTNAGAGNYQFTATAADEQGASATSAIVNITVLE